jgi:hypothetical protein
MKRSIFKMLCIQRKKNCEVNNYGTLLHDMYNKDICYKILLYFNIETKQEIIKIF